MKTRIVDRIVTLVAALGFAAFATITAAAQAATAEQGAGVESSSEGDRNTTSGNFVGAVFAMTNETAANRIVVYGRARDGTLTRIGSVRTRGLGIGVDTDTQGPLLLSKNHRYLYAVNPGSDDVSVLAVDGIRLKFLQRVYAGDQPLSLTHSGDLLYVLNGSVAGNGIRGFTVKSNGTLRELPDSFRLLSSPIAVPGEVRFSPDGRILLVTHKTTNVLLTPQNAIDAFLVGSDGYASALPIRNESIGLRPFSLAFRDNDKLVVVEAHNAAPNPSAASSYQVSSDGTLAVISGSVPNGQTDICWVVVSKNQRYAFVANFGSGTISTYRFAASGALTLIDGSAAFFGDLSQPVDLSQSADGRFLYQLLRGTGAVAALRVRRDGSLAPLGVVGGGLPVNGGASVSLRTSHIVRRQLTTKRATLAGDPAGSHRAHAALRGVRRRGR